MAPSLTVLSVAWPWAAVRDDAPGPAERVVVALDRGLIARGHTSIVVAQEGSRCDGHLIATPAPPSGRDALARKRAYATHRAAIRHALASFHIDVIHFHGLDFAAYAPSAGVPMIATLHLPLEWYSPDAFEVPDLHFCCVSEWQRRGLPDLPCVLPTIPYGVPLSRYRAAGTKRDYALLLGRISADKGVHLALAAARRAHVPLVLCGDVVRYGAGDRYFEEAVKPFLGEGAHLLPRLEERRRLRLLRGARCLLNTDLLPDAGAFTSIEALASGTPVVATKLGAMREVVSPGRTGILASSAFELCSALDEVTLLSPHECRMEAELRFGESQMVSSYVHAYESLARPRPARRRPRPEAPLELRVASTLSELEALREDWSRLCTRSACSTPFQSPEWMIPWIRHFAPRRWRVVTAWGDSGLLALAPMELSPRGGVKLLGGGATDYPDALVDASLGELGGALVFHAIRRSQSSTGPFLFHRLRTESPLLRPIGATGFEQELVETERCPTVALDEDPASHYSPALKRKLRRAEALLTKLRGGKLVAADEDRLDGLLHALFELHTLQGSARGLHELLMDPSLQRFHREVASGMLRRGLLRLYALLIRDRPAAVLYGFCDGRRMYSYAGAYDPAFERLSPGTLLLDRVIHEVRRTGVRELDLLRGRQRFKYAFGAVERPLYRRTLRPTQPAPSAPL